jgi:hypothetical protein
MNETKEKKTKTLEEKLVELHPKFLETVKEVYPLAVLSSLCIAVTAFTQQTHPEIQPYSITAAGLFLVAFIASFVFKIVQMEMLAFISYCSTAIAVLMLVLVVSGFATATPVLTKTMTIIPAGFMIVVMLSALLTFGRIMMKSKLKIARLSGFVSFFSFAFLTITIVVAIVDTFVGLSASDNWVFSLLFVPSLFVCIISLMVTTFFVAKERRMK